MKDIEKYNKIILLIELFIIFTVITLGIKYYFKPFIIIIIMLIIGRSFYDFFLKFNISYRVSGALSILLINVMLFCFVFYFGNEFIEILKKIYNKKVISVNFEADSVDENSDVMDIIMKTLDIMGNKIAENSFKQSDLILTVPTDSAGLFDIEKLDKCYKFGYDTVMKNIKKIKEIYN